MVNGENVAQSRWVTRALWLIAAGLAATILTLRSHGMLSTTQLQSDGRRPNAALAFSAPVSKGVVPFALDSLSWADHAAAPVQAGRPISVFAGATLTLTGWAFDLHANAPFAAIGARFDRHGPVASAVVGLPRPDVAAALRTSRAGASGFDIDIDTAHLTPGRHAIELRALERGGKTALSLGSAVLIDIAAPAALQHTDSVDALNGVVVNAAASHSAPIVVLRSYRKLTVYGWGFLSEGKRPATTAAILVDGAPAASATYGLTRPDVASAFRDVRLTRTGLSGTLSLESLSAGRHEIKFQFGAGDGSVIPSLSSVTIDLQ